MTRGAVFSKIDLDGAEACVEPAWTYSRAAVCDFINDAPHDANWILIKFLRSSFLAHTQLAPDLMHSPGEQRTQP
jgi:hypothetical protein